MPRFDLVKFCEAIQKYKVTIAHVVPPVLVLLAKEPVVDNYDLSSVTHFQSGAAPLSAELSIAVNTRLNTKCVQSYGMTESSPGSHIQPFDDDSHGKNQKIRTKSHIISIICSVDTFIFIGVIGKMVPGMRAKIVDDNGNGEFAERYRVNCIILFAVKVFLMLGFLTL